MSGKERRVAVFILMVWEQLLKAFVLNPHFSLGGLAIRHSTLWQTTGLLEWRLLVIHKRRSLLFNLQMHALFGLPQPKLNIILERYLVGFLCACSLSSTNTAARNISSEQSQKVLRYQIRIFWGLKKKNLDSNSVAKWIEDREFYCLPKQVLRLFF